MLSFYGTFSVLSSQKKKKKNLVNVFSSGNRCVVDGSEYVVLSIDANAYVLNSQIIFAMSLVDDNVVAILPKEKIIVFI